MTTRNRPLAAATLAAALHGALLAASLSAQPAEDFGILVMAHGGGTSWDAGVLEAVEPLRERYPLEVAFGMADAGSIQDAAARLEAEGVRDIAVVRLFISGESWYERTQQILGLAEGAPPAAPSHHHDHAASAANSATAAPALTHTAGSGGAETSAGHGGHAMGFWRIDSQARFGMSEEGLAEAPESGEVLLDRALALSVRPAAEDVLLLAHGPGSDEENARWLAYMDAHGETLRQQGFHSVKAATLREDWPEERKLAEQEIRAYVAESAAAGREVIVLPFRVHGFGPYAKVLEGLNYRADETGLIPHPAVSHWIERQALALRDSAFGE